jgi:hypothetical protein
MRVIVTATNRYGSSSMVSPPTAPVAVSTRAVVKVTGRRSAGRRHRPRPKVRGTVLTRPQPNPVDDTELHGQVEIKLYRRTSGNWRSLSPVRTARVAGNGRFKKRLGAFRRCRHSGMYRVSVKYAGARGAGPSAPRSRTFKLSR